MTVTRRVVGRVPPDVYTYVGTWEKVKSEVEVKEARRCVGGETMCTYILDTKCGNVCVYFRYEMWLMW